MTPLGSKLVNGAVLAAAIGTLGAVWLTRGAVTTVERDARTQNLFPAWRSQDVARVELDQGGQKLVIERDSGGDSGTAGYRLSAPVHEPADPDAVGTWLEKLATASPIRRLPGAVDRAALGLDAPRAQLVIHMGAISYDVSLGGSAPSPKAARYVEVRAQGVESPGIALVGESVASELSVDFDAFRSKTLVAYAQSEVRRIELKSPKLALDLVRKDARFQFAETKRRADRELTDSLFFQLSRLTAEHFLDLPTAERALGAGPAELSITPVDGARSKIVLAIGGPCPNDPQKLTLIRRQPDVRAACVARELSASLDLTTADFADRHVFALHPDEVEELSLEDTGKKLRLLRKGTAFVLHGAHDTEVDLAAGNQHLSDLTRAAGEFVSPEFARAGLESSSRRIVLRSSAAREAAVQEEVVRVGQRDAKGGVFIERVADGATLRLERDAARAFFADGTLLRSRKIFDFGPSSVISLELRWADNHERLTRAPNGTLALELPKGFSHDGALAIDLMQAIGTLTTERWVADTDDGSFGLDKPVLSAEISYQPGDAGVVVRSLRVGSSTSGGAFAALDGEPAVFALARETLETLQTSLVNRSEFLTDPSTVSLVRIEGGGKSLALERRGATFAARPALVSEARAGEIMDALAILRAEAALHTGPAKPAEGLDKPQWLIKFDLQVGPAKKKTIRIGAGDSWRSTSVFYARVDGLDASFVIAQSKVRAITDAL